MHLNKDEQQHSNKKLREVNQHFCIIEEVYLKLPFGSQSATKGIVF